MSILLHDAKLRRFLSLVGILVFVFNIKLIQAQSIRGKLVDETGTGLVNILVELDNGKQTTHTNALGIFRFLDVKDGKHTISSSDPTVTFLKQTFTLKNSIDLGDILTEKAKGAEVTRDIATVSIDDLELIEDAQAGNISSILSANGDAFIEAAAYNLSNGRFRMRGYFNQESEVYLNGMPVQDLDDGRIVWNAWGGLNDVVRVQSVNLSLRDSPFAFGGIGGGSLIDLRASVQRVQKKVVYTLGNRSYTNRLMYTHSTGLMQNNWAITASVSRRWGQSGFIQGTHYDAYSYFLSVDRKLSSSHSLNFVLLGAPLRRGKIGPSVQEAYDLAGSNFYNPNWGYQNGEIRNSREDIVHQPILQLRHDWTPSRKTTLTTTVGFQFGKFGNTRLDWYNAPDPRPDYYRKLPSFQLSEDVAESLTNAWQTNESVRQVNWDEFYEVNKNNRTTINNVDGVDGQSVTGNLSAYVVQEQRFDSKKLSFNSTFQSLLSNKVTLTGGLMGLFEENHNFTLVNDLLGGDFHVNYDEFALQDFPNDPDAYQNDLNNPNAVIREGDVYGYDYFINDYKALGWFQGSYIGKNVDAFVAAKFEGNAFERVGNMRNGRFPDQSFGSSGINSFVNYGIKAGITYKIDGRNYLYGVVNQSTRSPFSRFAYLSARTRDQIVDGLTSENIFATEGGYVATYGKLKAKLTGYLTTFKNQIENATYYHDELRTFVNYSMTGVDKRHAGLELGARYKINSQITLEVAAAEGQYIYTSRPTAVITADNSSETLSDPRTVFIKDFFVAGTPQRAASVGLEFQSKKYWWISTNVNYYAKNYLDINPDRRTEVGIDGIIKAENPELWNSVLAQEELDNNFTLDFYGGKSFKFGDYYLVATLSVGNILNTTNFRTGGFEQFRFDYENKDVNRFPPRYFYAYGRNYSLNISLRF